MLIAKSEFRENDGNHTILKIDLMSLTASQRCLTSHKAICHSDERKSISELKFPGGKPLLIKNNFQL